MSGDALHKRQLLCEIAWLNQQLENPLTEKQRRTYLHQIQHKEYTIMLVDYFAKTTKEHSDK